MITQILLVMALIGYSISEEEVIQHETMQVGDHHITKSKMTLRVAYHDMIKFNQLLNNKKYEPILRQIMKDNIQSIVPDVYKEEYVITFIF